MKTYSEMILLPTFEERFEYLKLNGRVCEDTFGFDRYLNQTFYKSRLWQNIRDQIIIRDNCCDLAVEGYDIDGLIIIHHLNPILADDILNNTDHLLNPEYLVATSHRTHNAIHYGDSSLLPQPPQERYKFDTCPWRIRNE